VRLMLFRSQNDMSVTATDASPEGRPGNARICRRPGRDLACEVACVVLAWAGIGAVASALGRGGARSTRR
jgi:hypothetical protein